MIAKISEAVLLAKYNGCCMVRLVALFVCGLIVGGDCFAELPKSQFEPIKGRRLIRRFDFEEAKFNNFEDLPMYWYAIGREAITTDRNFMHQPLHRELVAKPGFPSYTQVGFDRPQDEPGEHRLHLGLNGGSVGAFVEVGALPAVPHSDYLILATVRTSSLKHARARLVAYFVNQSGERIEGSVKASDLVQTDGRDRAVSVRLHGDFDEAAWVGLQVELLQSRDQSGVNFHRHEVYYEEVEGDAWFDDISVWQLPHAVVESQDRVNLIRSPDRPRLLVKVRDMTSRPLSIELTVYDYRSRVVSQTRRKVDEWTPISWQWRPALDRFGWYLVDMQIFEPVREGGDEDVRVARSLSAFIWLPPEGLMYSEDTHRFMLIVEEAPEAELLLMPDVLARSQLSSIILSCWNGSTTERDVDDLQRVLGDVVQLMTGRGQKVGMSLNPIPDTLSQSLNVDSREPLALFSKGGDSWVGYLTPVLMRHGQRVRRWQLGSAVYPSGYFRKDLPDLMALIYKEFRNLAPQPRLLVPWHLSQPRRLGLDANLSFMIQVPPSVGAEHFSAYIDEWREEPQEEFWFHLSEPPATVLVHEKRVADFVLRMLHAWEIEPTGLAMSRPWTDGGTRKLSLLPDPLLGVYSNVAHRLAGRRVVGRLPLGEGLECMIFDGPSGGMLAAWNRSSAAEEALIEMFLGSLPETVDVWGNRERIPLVDKKHRVQLTTTPIFIEGIDASLAKFRASFKVDPPFIESTIGNHHRVLRFFNPWPFTISGHMNLRKPEHWEIQPNQHHFSIASGHSAVVPVDLTFPVTEVAGKKRLVAHFDFLGGERYAVDVGTAIELGLKEVEFDATVSVEVDPTSGRRDIMVTEMIKNRGSKRMALYAFANMAGYPRQERLITRLDPGQLVIRRFRFPGGVELFQKSFIRVGVRESVGPAMLNMVLSGKDLYKPPKQP